MTERQDTVLHTKYRPSSVDELIGHEDVVTRIRGMLKKDQIPGAMLFLGPPSVGKTTLARCIAGTVNGKPIEQQVSDYKELDSGSNRSIEDVRALIGVSKFKPQHKKRFIVIDEAQSILSNKVAADALLLTLESAGKTDTVWILCSMDPGKFQTSTTGRAIMKRCQQFVLKPHTDEDLTAQARRIIKGEKLKFLWDPEIIKELVSRSDSEMRTLANLIASASDYWSGLKTKPEKLPLKALSEALVSTEDAAEGAAVDIVVGALTGQFAKVQRAVLTVEDTFMLTKKLLWVSQFLLNVAALDGKKHPRIQWYGANREAHKQLGSAKVTLGTYAALVETMVKINQEAAAFTIGADALISAHVYRFIKNNPPK